jgi:hypothetical protein
MNETTIQLSLIIIGIILLVFLFYNIRRTKQPSTESLRKIPISETLEEGFIVRFPRRYPFTVVIHRKDCSGARLPREANRSSSWIGYFQDYKDAQKYSSLISEIVSKNKPVSLTITDCSICNPQINEN